MLQEEYNIQTQKLTRNYFHVILLLLWSFTRSAAAQRSSYLVSTKNTLFDAGCCLLEIHSFTQGYM
jgi:hypothetical protein